MLSINEGDPMLTVGPALLFPAHRGGVSERNTSDISCLSVCPPIAVLVTAGGGCLWWLLWWGPPSVQPHTSSWWLCTTLRIQSLLQRWQRLSSGLQSRELWLSWSVSCDYNLTSLCKSTTSWLLVRQMFSVLICQIPRRLDWGEPEDMI